MQSRSRDQTSIWQELLRRLTRVGKTDLFPLFVYNAAPPVDTVWPEGLPLSSEIRAFYSLCNGGYFACSNWFASEELPRRNEKWSELLRDYRTSGESVLLNHEHLVLGEDSGGCPIVWRRSSGQVSTFQFDGG